MNSKISATHELMREIGTHFPSGARSAQRFNAE